MDDKDLAKIDQLLSQMVTTIQELRAALPILASIPPAPKASGLLRQALQRQVRSAQQLYMSGRWFRRDGNVYGSVARYKQRTSDADSTPGDLRTPDQR